MSGCPRTSDENLICRMPFVVSLSNHERPFDRLRANGLNFIFEVKEERC